MNIDISPHLCFLLWKNNIVVLPGFGAFVANDRPAKADYAQGKIFPPASALVFNENIKSDDSSLAELLSQTERLSREEARDCISNFVENLESVVQRKQTFNVKGIGNLYLDSSGALAFDAAESAAFNMQTFGLPVLHCRPISNSRRVIVSKPQSAPLPEERVEKRNSWFRRPALAYGLSTFLLLLVLVVFSTIPDHMASSAEEVQVVPTGEMRVNVKPVSDSAASDEQLNADLTIFSVGDSGTTVHRNESPAGEIKSEGGAKVEKAVEVVRKTIIVGTFSKQENADRVVRRLENAHFKVYQKRSGAMTRVGAQLTDGAETELRAALARLQKMFGKDIWELEKNTK